MIPTNPRVRPPSAERLLWNKIYLYRRILAVLVVSEAVLVGALVITLVKR